MLTMNILKKEQKSSLPDLNQIKDFVQRKVANKDMMEFIDILNEKSGESASTYLTSIDNLFKTYKYIDALTYLNTIMENRFGAPDLPLITITNKSNIRSSMIQEAEVIDTIPKSPKALKDAVRKSKKEQRKKRAE